MLKPLLFEIGLEELPTKAVLELSHQLKNLVEEELSRVKIQFKEINYFSTPRRLALVIEDLADKQEDYVLEKKGPAVKLAFDEEGNPTKALQGFIKSNHISVDMLQQKEIAGHVFMVYLQQISGKSIKELMPELLTTALKKLTITKPMRWGSSELEFVRPIHWLCLMYGDELIKTTIFDVATDNKTYGHRFHAPHSIQLKQANDYIEALKTEGYVVASFQVRKENIRRQIQKLAKDHNAIEVITEELLNEVTALVEWPVALIVDFDEKFLSVPAEALISAMRTHQKVFHLITSEGTLLPKFITIANIKSTDEEKVIQGNARVMRARLSDAAFFFANDCKATLESGLEKLKEVIFQKQLGSMYERSERLENLAAYIAQECHFGNDEIEKIKKAARLAKADLTTTMVQEFPELQGIMGFYYAKEESLDDHIAVTIRDHYLPRPGENAQLLDDFAAIVSLADRIDNLVGTFGIGQVPSGAKDPFALRRAAIGLLSILIDRRQDLNLRKLVAYAVKLYGARLINNATETDVCFFIMERLKNRYQEQQKIKFYNAVYEGNYERNSLDLYDFDLRLKAVEEFSQLPEAESLAAANKRVSNMLTKENINPKIFKLDVGLLQEDVEKKLAKAIQEKNAILLPLIETRKYANALKELAGLRELIDTFFNEVMVMVDDSALKNNRMALLCSLRNLFLEVADISKL